MNNILNRIDKININLSLFSDLLIHILPHYYFNTLSLWVGKIFWGNHTEYINAKKYFLVLVFWSQKTKKLIAVMSLHKVFILFKICSCKHLLLTPVPTAPPLKCNKRGPKSSVLTFIIPRENENLRLLLLHCTFEQGGEWEL